MKENFLFTSESVSEGHPDKLCDIVSDTLVDAFIGKDPNSRVALECITKTGFIMVCGELTTKAEVDIQKVVREAIKEIGYSSRWGFDPENCGVLTSISKQSPDIAMGVDSKEDHEQGAGDQGLMFGYATNETEEFMPLPIILAHKILIKLSELRKSGELDYLGPDAKSQATIEYENFKPKRIHTIVLSSQHSADVSLDILRKELIEKVIKPVCGDLMDSETIIYINPTGRFVIGGPVGDTGLTGRKIIVDSYGGMGRHGGGAFSGKDPSKVDRSGAYAARYIAKNVVASGLADRCEIQVSYAIGIAKPLSVLVDCFGTNKIPEEKIEEAIKKVFSLKPAEIIRTLDLKKPVYAKTASYGPFGRSEFSWEKIDKVEELRKAIE
ncbi:MAG: methionine adenosyltransferase [archaeon]